MDLFKNIIGVIIFYQKNGCFNLLTILFSELKKLSEESLTRQPEEVFDIICKLGEGYVFNVIYLIILVT